MGLGGYLTWTAVAREIVKKNKNPEIKIYPHEGNVNVLLKSPIFFNNPNIFQGETENAVVFPIQLNKPETNYCKLDTPTYAKHRYDKHIIEQICEFYDIQNPELKCDLYFTKEEDDKVNKLKQSLNKNFVAIEPHSKLSYTPNRSYPFDKWQEVVNKINKNVQVVQVGTKNNKVLDGVVDFTGETTFREAARLIAAAKLFLSSEGGLVHASTAVDAKSIVVLTGYQSLRMIEYPTNTYVNIAKHGPCGMKIECNNCLKDAERHDYGEIVRQVEKELK